MLPDKGLCLPGLLLQMGAAVFPLGKLRRQLIQLPPHFAALAPQAHHFLLFVKQAHFIRLRLRLGLFLPGLAVLQLLLHLLHLDLRLGQLCIQRLFFLLQSRQLLLQLCFAGFGLFLAFLCLGGPLIDPTQHILLLKAHQCRAEPGGHFLLRHDAAPFRSIGRRVQRRLFSI